MKGLMHLLQRGCMMAALASLVGCHVFPKKDCPDCSPVSEADCGCQDCKSGRKGKKFDWEQVSGDHCWPEQYTRESARRVNAPFGQQMINGTRIEMTVWQHYFSKEDGHQFDLNEAGKRRLTYFARRKPFIIPTLELETSFDQELDSKRIASVVSYLEAHSLEPQPWTVALVNREPVGLFGREAPKNIEKMIGPGAGPPPYEIYIKQDFYQSEEGP